MVVEIKGFKPAVGGMLGFGLLANIVAVATLVNQRIPMGAAVCILALGLALTITAIRAFLTQRYQLRATEQGVSFAGSALVAWSEIDQIFVARIKSPIDRVSNTPALVAITFRHKRTLFRLPLTYWISSPFSIGDVDIALYKMFEPPYSIVAHLQALRAQAVGTVDGVTVGASDLPSAQVIERPR
ncbi:MAG: hypothetical protein HOV81_23980 [Kofleriaceae bacterium]|nr:hypothetical protein [Kofleriaceae bacterium]